MAIYIGEKEENCLFKASQRLHNFPTIHNEVGFLLAGNADVFDKALYTLDRSR
jgi:hypothetical protein